jgi:hypothetical protein
MDEYIEDGYAYLAQIHLLSGDQNAACKAAQKAFSLKQMDENEVKRYCNN